MLTLTLNALKYQLLCIGHIVCFLSHKPNLGSRCQQIRLTCLPARLRGQTWPHGLTINRYLHKPAGMEYRLHLRGHDPWCRSAGLRAGVELDKTERNHALFASRLDVWQALAKGKLPMKNYNQRPSAQTLRPGEPLT